MNIFTKKTHRYLVSKLLLIFFIATLLLPAWPLLFSGLDNGKAVAAEVYDNLALKAARNNYNLHQGGQAVDGGWGNFGAYDAYILTQAGADVGTWVYNGKSFKDSVLSLIDATIANEGKENQSSAKRVAHEYLAAKAFGDARATQLLNILKNRQTAGGNGSFDKNAFSDLPAFEALGRAGDMAEIDAAAAITYILSCQDGGTGAWTSTWNDFQATAQAVRALEYLKPLAGGQAEVVQTAIDRGMAWLQGRQQDDGSFRDAGGFDDPLVDTAETILTLNCLGMDPAVWTVGGKSAVDYMRDSALNEDGTFGTSKNLMDNTWALDAYRVLGGNISPDAVLSLRVTPASANIVAGGSQQYTAQIYKLNGTNEDVSAAADWSVNNSSIATVNNRGLVTGVAAGNTVITATYQGVSGTADVSVAGGGNNGGNNDQQGIRVTIKVIGRSGETLFGPSTVTLRESDRWGVTALGALDKTGLSYNDANPSYIDTIAGQGPQGMNGWMYKVNGVVPGVPAKDYPVANNDLVVWWYSTSPTEISGVSSNTKENPNILDDKKLSDTIQQTGQARLNLAEKTDGKGKLSLHTIVGLANDNKPLTIESKGLQVEFAPQSLITEELMKVLEDKNAALEIGAREVSGTEKQEILSKASVGESTGLFDIGAKIVDLTAQIIRTSNDGTVNTDVIKNFQEPVKVTIDLSGSVLNQEDIAKLTGIRYEKDTQGNVKPVKLGGAYDSEKKTFTFYSDKFSLYGVVKAKDLKKISLGVNKLTTTVNGKTIWLDIPPVILGNRTMVPLRFIGENLGAEVEWIAETKTVEMMLDGKKVTLVIGETGPGLDTPATIITGRTLVPIRYVSESLGAYVTWFPSSRMVEIVK